MSTSNRTTRKQVEGIFEVFVKTIGGRVSTAWNDSGAYVLDYSPYGGYLIEQHTTTGGGVSHPFGDMRRKASDMWDTLHFAIRTIEHMQGH